MEGERRPADGAHENDARTMKSNTRFRELVDDLKARGVRPTRQRLSLLYILFRFGHRHVGAEQLYQEARDAGVRLSLATVYNTLNQLAEIGMIRKVVVNTGQTFFDTNTTDHHHYFDQDRNHVFDIEGSGIEVSKLPPPPPGYEIAGVEIVVRLKVAGSRAEGEGRAPPV